MQLIPEFWKGFICGLIFLLFCGFCAYLLMRHIDRQKEKHLRRFCDEAYNEVIKQIYQDETIGRDAEDEIYQHEINEMSNLK